MTTSVKNNFLPPALVSNLQEVLISRKGGEEEPSKKPDESSEAPSSSLPSSSASETVNDCSKPVVLVTNGDGIEAPGLTFLVEALVLEGQCNVHVCAPQSDKSVSGHSVTLREKLEVSSAEISRATAFEVSGTPADCVSLALSGALFSWSKPALVISGINRGSSCGNQIFYSGAVAGAREALICGVPSVSISLKWKEGESSETDFKDAVKVCLPLIHAAIRDIEKGVFPKSCVLNIEIPTSPLTNKGFKVTKQSLWRSLPSWQAVSATRHPSAGFMSNQQSLGLQLAQLSRDASAAGAARRIGTQRKNVEIESVGVAAKPGSQRVKKYFRLEFLEREQEETDEDLDFRALENGFVAITPLSLSSYAESETQASASEWIAAALSRDQ
ncbi:5'-nucleotidase SurE-like [Telopea speciosissima]|uniref:5'-nucleotidase SurE-like n=1 Tax=Telopea speciosissima TaxID=54955 RepID=UPI001CC541F8|nr:5'-nucleotidase SurE-like [Telopea speciosissima]XP_043707331.1 5'-nucleotidase SurE-like [Telopea speciosissima]